MKNLHLVISVVLVTIIALAYGANPQQSISFLFDFGSQSTDSHSIFRAMMGLYLGMALIWTAGIMKPYYWEMASVVNIVFMLGLAIGRLAGFLLDGLPSPLLVTGFFAEVLLAALAYYNLKRYKKLV